MPFGELGKRAAHREAFRRDSSSRQSGFSLVGNRTGKPSRAVDLTIINEGPDRLIAWRSLEGADVPSAGSIRFEPAPRDEGTEVTVALEYDPLDGTLGASLAKLTGDEVVKRQSHSLWGDDKLVPERRRSSLSTE